MSEPHAIPFESYASSVRDAFDAVNGAAIVEAGQPILLKPNLVNASPFPVTTSPDFVEAVIKVIRDHTDASITVAEGCGSATMETDAVFAELGYVGMARRSGVSLLDLNHAPLVKKSRPELTIFPEMWLPEVAFTHCIISLPVLKAHSLATITGTLKNMLGFAPPTHYQGGGGWKKSLFHSRMHDSISDLCAYVAPHLTIMDATVGLAQYHLGGPECDPPVNRILAGTDAMAVDRLAARLLGIDWQQVGHLR